MIGNFDIAKDNVLAQVLCVEKFLFLFSFFIFLVFSIQYIMYGFFFYIFLDYIDVWIFHL